MGVLLNRILNEDKASLSYFDPSTLHGASIAMLECSECCSSTFASAEGEAHLNNATALVVFS